MGSYKTIQEAQSAVTPNHYVALNQDGTFGVFEKDTGGQWIASCQYAYSVAGVPFPAVFYGLVQNTAPVQNQAQSPALNTQQNGLPESKEPFYKSTWFVVLLLILFPPVGIILAWVFKKPTNSAARIVLTVVSVLILIIALTPKGSPSTTSTSPKAQTQQETKKEESKKEEPKVEATPKADTTAPKTEAPAEPSETISQKNALKKAKDYLNYSAFSYTGLIEQLEYEKFSTEDATYAVDNCGADWNKQAEKKAADYLEYSSFSRDGLIEQLEYEGFTFEQATHGVDSTGL